MKCFKSAQIFCACLFMLLSGAVAQPDTSNTEKLLHYIMQPLDKSQVPTGFLEEWGVPIVPMATFNGTLTDSNRMDMNLWRTLYFQLQTGFCAGSTNPLPDITSTNTAIKQYEQNSLPVPIPLLIGQYSNVKSYAFNNNLLAYNSGTNQVADVGSRPESPYEVKNLFAACPDDDISFTGSASFVVPAVLIWNTTGKTISSLQIDFDNTLGMRSLTIGTPITVSYTDTGTKRWTIRLTFTDNSVWQCYSQYTVLKAASTNTAARYVRDAQDDIWTINANVNHNGGRVFVRYSRSSPTSTLRKPLLIIEGYDGFDAAPGFSKRNYDYNDFIDAIDAPFPAYDFNGKLDDVAGYDLLFVDFNQGTDDIVSNAALVEEILGIINGTGPRGKVNDDRFNNIRQQNVVMGHSMGGLVARYALAKMTKNNVATETRLFISHDSPHRGANIPLGLQYLVNMAGEITLFGKNIRSVYPEYDEVINLLARPASQQLLIYRATGTTTYTNNTFLDGAYRSMITFSASDPQPSYRFIATSLGSECAHPQYSPYTKLIDVDANGLVFLFPVISYRLKTIVEGYALPTTGLTSKIARFTLSSKFKLFLFITISKNEYDNTAYAPGTQLPVDGAPGSTSATAGGVSIYDIHRSGPIVSLLGISGYVSVNVNATPGKFTYVPVVSALDINPLNNSALSETYINGFNQNYPSTSETYIAQETNTTAGTTNNVHLQYTARNANWLFNEMENLPNDFNCSSECSSTNFMITGNNTLCTTADYTINNIPANANVTWSASPYYLVTIAPIGNGKSATFTKQGNGNITITATLACGITVTKYNVRVGAYTHSDYTIYSYPNTVVYGQTVQFGPLSSQVTGATSYNWIYSGGLSYISGQGTRVLTLRVPYYSPYQTGGDVGLSVGNDCGVSSYFPLTHFNYSNSFRIAVSPNPAKNNLNVIFLEKSDKEEKANLRSVNPKPLLAIKSTGKTIFTLFEFNTSLQVRQWKQNETKSNIQNLNIAGLRKGLYVLQVDRDNETTTTKIIVE